MGNDENEQGNRITIGALWDMTDDEVRDWLASFRDPDLRREALAMVERERAERNGGSAPRR